MNRHFLSLAIALPMILLLLASTGHAGLDDAFNELTTRSIKTIEETARANAKAAREKINVEAAILAGYTLAVKNPNDDAVASLRGAALAVNKLDLMKLATFGSTIKTAPKAPADIKNVKVELVDLMEIFRNKAKGGEGIHVDLQYQPKLAKLNGIESFIGALGAKKISAENLAKISKELPNLAYRTAVVASLTHEMAPAKGAGQWRDLSLKMRDASIALAEAAKKKNAEGVFTAAQVLESTCTQCHSAFKNK